MKKKFLYIVIATVLSTSLLAGCGSSTKSTDTTSKTNTTSSNTTSTNTENKTKDGTYTAKEKEFDKYGYKGEIAVTYKDGKIDKVTFEEFDKDGKKKTENTEYNTKMKAVSKIDAKEAYAKLIQGVVSTGKVDTVTGATGIATKFKALYEEALKTAK